VAPHLNLSPATNLGENYMTDKEHRLGVDEVTLVTRHLKLVQASLAAIPAAIKEIDHIYGLDAICFDEKSQVLTISYDAVHTGIESIEDILVKHEISVSHDWWTHFKEGYYRFGDENVRVMHIPNHGVVIKINTNLKTINNSMNKLLIGKIFKFILKSESLLCKLKP
jgi:hypothetical protein